MILTVTPFAHPEWLPAGTEIWTWTVTDGQERIATGSVQRIAGLTSTHASEVIPSRQRQGIYSRFVLPGLVKEFGTLHSDLFLAEGSRAAWKRAGGTWDGSRFMLKK